MSQIPWWHSAVFYQIFPRSFADANGDGIGDLTGIISRLDYLVDTMPVDAIWLSPFYPSPQADFGYDVADYCDVDPAYGELATFDRLVAECHARGLRLIVDWVPNHTSSLHPWFIESVSSRSNVKRDWYVWADPKEDGTPPNNWISVFGGSSWEFHPASGQYYLHSFLVEQPDLNWRNPKVEEAMFDTLRFWLDRGVDGFRIDVAHFLMKDPLMRDNPPARKSYEGHPMDSEYVAFEHVYDKAHADIHPLYRRLRSVVDEYPDRFTVGEVHEYDWPKWVTYYGADLDEMHMPFNFALLPTGLDPAALRETIESVEKYLPSGAWPSWVWGNHDERRMRTRLGDKGSRVAAVLQLTLRGTPFIYYGDELGMINDDVGAEARQDPREPQFNRDGNRTPMLWDRSPNAGFSPATVDRTWLPVSNDSSSVAEELGDADSHLELYRHLLHLRRQEMALQTGAFEWLEGFAGDCLGYTRSLPGAKTFAVFMNLGVTPVEVGPFDEVLASTDRGLEGSKVSLLLSPTEAIVTGIS